MNFKEADLEDVISFLSQKADVNIIIDHSVYRSALLPVGSGGTAAPQRKAGENSAESKAPSRELGRITLRLKNVPLKFVLKYVLRYKNLRYIVEDYAIVIVPVGWAPREELCTRVFRLKAPSFEALRLVRQQAARTF